jgi:two-component system KDP operon response regulator KdpE
VLFDAGADDYVTKPFNLEEFAARARAHVRRARSQTPLGTPVITIGDLCIDQVRRRVTRAGQRISLTPTEWEILSTLAAHAGRTLTHRQIFDAVWRGRFGNAQQHLRVHITNLRRKIEVDPTAPCVIITEPGVGYRVETGE